MPPRLKITIRRLLLVLHLLTILMLLLSAFLPRLHPHRYWISGMAGMPFLIFLVLVLCFIPVWIFYRKKYYLVSIAALLICIQPLTVSFGANLFGHHVIGPKAQNGFSIMTFNTSSFGLKDYIEDTAIQNNTYRMLQTARPDILCLQEFYSCDDTPRTDHLRQIAQQLGYSAHFFTNDRMGWDSILHFGIVLYTRFPVLNAQRIPMDSLQMGSGSSILQADLLINHDTVRVYTVQLKSYMFTQSDFAEISKIKHLHDFTFTSTRHILGKMHRTFASRAAEADTLHALISHSPYPALICGDFNDVPVSYTYNTLSEGMKDTFLSEGWGLGCTFHALSPTLRIDYILTQPSFHCDGYQTFPHKGFEHVPVMAALSLRR